MVIDPQLKEDLKKYIEERLQDSKKTVFVFSPYKLTEKDLSMLHTHFPFLDASRVINMIDKSLIAGIVVKFGTKMIDLSLRTELQNLKQTIYAIT
ncbi:MAG: synthase delta subunit [Candidatus Parcubacteria bacterium]|jgi:F0F1-type ATP synthase delta subunit